MFPPLPPVIWFQIYFHRKFKNYKKNWWQNKEERKIAEERERKTKCVFSISSNKNDKTVNKNSDKKWQPFTPFNKCCSESVKRRKNFWVQIKMCNKQVLRLIIFIVCISSQVHCKQQNQQRRNRNSGKLSCVRERFSNLIIVIHTNLQYAHS